MFGFDLIDASLVPAIFIAFLSGLLSFVSPCVLPIVPPYLAYMSGAQIDELASNSPRSRKSVLTAAFFVLGLSTVFLILGFTASVFGSFILKNQEVFSQISGVIVMFFGLHFLGILSIPFLNRDLRIDAGDRGGSAFGAYILGLAFAFGWTPCIGPQLGAILTIAAAEASMARGTCLLFVYAMGLGLPFIAVAMWFTQMGRMLTFMKRHMARIERITGLLLWTTGLLMLTGGFSQLSYWLLEVAPIMENLG